MKDIYRILIKNLTNERLDRIAFRDKSFCSTDKELDRALKEYGKLSLPEKDARVINHIFEIYAQQCAGYGALAYRQGIEDAVQLLKEMSVL